MKKMSLVVVFFCVSAGVLGASERPPAIRADALAGLQREKQMVEDAEEALRAFKLPVNLDTKVAGAHGEVFVHSPLKKSISVPSDVVPNTPPFNCCAPSPDSLTNIFVFSVKSAAALPSAFGSQVTTTALSAPLPLPLQLPVDSANARIPSVSCSDKDDNEETGQDEEEGSDSDDDLLQA